MAIKTVPTVHTTVSAATAAGLVTVGSSSNLAAGAKVWLSGIVQTRLDYNTKTAGWTNGETITGETSGATATISVVGGAPGAAAGTLVLTAVTGTFQAGELLDGSTSGVGVANATAPQYQFQTAGNFYCKITSVPDATHVTLRRLADPGQVLEDVSSGGAFGKSGANIPNPNYNNSDVSAVNALGGFLDQERQDIYVTNSDNSLRTQA